MGRKWTQEEKDAASAAARARMGLPPKDQDAAPEQPSEEAPTTPPSPEQSIEEPPTTVKDDSEASQGDILARAIEAITLLTQMQATNGGSPTTGPQVKNGQLTGTLDRYSVKKSDYTDFTARLAAEPALRRFGFKENYELTYKFEVVRYQTIDKFWMQEPKMTVDLNRVIYDEETGMMTDGRYKEYRIVIHEDPDTALAVARMNGLVVPDSPEEEKDFLNEMRYLQVRDWLIECFMPKRPTSHNNRKEMVVNGKLVEYFETNSEGTSKLQFDQLNSKL